MFIEKFPEEFELEFIVTRDDGHKWFNGLALNDYWFDVAGYLPVIDRTSERLLEKQALDYNGRFYIRLLENRSNNFFLLSAGESISYFFNNTIEKLKASSIVVKFYHPHFLFNFTYEDSADVH